MTGRPLRLPTLMACFWLAIVCIPPFVTQADDNIYSELSLEALMKINVISASKKAEPRLSSPVNMVIITRQDIRDRGYTELSEIFDDLPGMDISRSYGSSYFKNYMRGFRSYSGSYYLLLIDGIEFNNLYNHDEWIMTAFPISNIDHIEIVYGPSSSIYGVNALMGVVNIITERQLKNGARINGYINSGFQNDINADLTVAYRQKDFGIRISGRVEHFELRDRIDSESYEWTRDRYYTSRELWGNILDNPSLGGPFSSENFHKGLDVRVNFGSSEVAIQYFKVDADAGLVTPGDQLQSRSKEPMQEISYSLSHSRTLIPDILHSKTLLRFRQSEWTADSPFIYAGPHHESKVDGEPMIDRSRRDVSITYFQAFSSSLSIFQDFDITPSQNISLVTGLKYERKDLPKNWESTATPIIDIHQFDAINFIPPPAMPRYQAQNRIIWTDFGGYLQFNWHFSSNHHLVGGIRMDHNSEYGTVTTFRGSLVSQFKPITLKAMYGEGYQEPTTRLIYENWAFAGANAALKPTHSRTYELKCLFVKPHFSADISSYYIRTQNSVLQFQGGAQNIGRKEIWGLDLNVRAQFFPSFLNKLSIWGSYAYIDARGDEEIVTDASGMEFFRWGALGDIADHKLYFGSTISASKNSSITVLGRYIGKRKTIYSNPVRTINAYLLFDLNISFRNLFNSGLGLSFKIKNIFDRNYFHPGYAGASSGNSPGDWVDGEWHGSLGYYNSLLPQPKRRFCISLTWMQ